MDEVDLCVAPYYKFAAALVGAVLRIPVVGVAQLCPGEAPCGIGTKKAADPLAVYPSHVLRACALGETNYTAFIIRFVIGAWAVNVLQAHPQRNKCCIARIGRQTQQLFYTGAYVTAVYFTHFVFYLRRGCHPYIYRVAGPYLQGICILRECFARPLPGNYLYVFFPVNCCKDEVAVIIVDGYEVVGYFRLRNVGGVNNGLVVVVNQRIGR